MLKKIYHTFLSFYIWIEDFVILILVFFKIHIANLVYCFILQNTEHLSNELLNFKAGHSQFMLFQKKSIYFLNLDQPSIRSNCTKVKNRKFLL